MSQNQRVKVSNLPKWGGTVLLSAFFFFTFQSGQEESGGKPLQQRVRVLENYSAKISHGSLKVESQTVLKLEGQISLQANRKKLGSEEQEDLDIAKIQAEKYHQLLDLEERISLHKGDQSFPRASYKQKAQRLRNEIKAIDESRSVAH